MTKLNFVNRARKNIYAEGKTIQYKSTRGKHAGETLERVDRAQPANVKDKIIIHKGDFYYWWQFAFGERQISVRRPPRSALTRSEFLGAMFDFEDAVSGIGTEITEDEREDIASELEDTADQVESLGCEQEDKRSNMPDQLQDSDAGQLLETRAEQCAEIADQLRQAAESVRSTEEDEDTDVSGTVDISSCLEEVNWKFE